MQYASLPRPARAPSTRTAPRSGPARWSFGEAVHRASHASRDGPLGNIARDGDRVAFRRRTETAGAWRHQGEPLPGLQNRGIAVEHDPRSRLDLAVAARAAAEQAPALRAL